MNFNLILKDMKCFIDYLDSKNNFQETRKDFKTYEDARKWMFKNFENPNIDMINYY